VEKLEDEGKALQAAALQNAQAILIARQRADEELARAHAALERKTEELQASEMQLRMVMDYAPVFIARCDRESRFRFVNRRYAERFGLRSHELIGKSIAEVLGPEAFATLRPYVESVLAGETVTYEAEVNYRHIGRRYMRCAYEPERDSEGDVQGWIAVISDITEQHRAEEAKALLGTIVESSQDAIVSKTLDGRILSWNAGAERLFGYLASEAVGQPITMIIPSDRQNEESLILLRIQRGERIGHYETQRVSKNGQRIDVSLSISPLRDSTGRIVGASKIARDISARKRAEHASRFLADASTALAELTDYETTLQRIANLAVPAFADWCAVHVQTPEGGVRRLAVTHLDPNKVELVRELARQYPSLPSDPRGVHRVLRTGEPEWASHIPDELLASAAQDEVHLTRIRALGLRSYLCVPVKSHGTVVGALTFATSESGRTYDAQDLQMAEDLAHRVAVAIENSNLLAALRETDRRKDEFLATLAHELRNPLAPVSNALQVMRLADGGSGITAELRAVMERQVQQLIRLVDDLMEVSRISRGKIELRKEPVELSTILRSALETCRPQIEEAGHHLQLNVADAALHLYADQLRLSQVFSNLLTNAAKYMEPNGRIEVSTHREGAEAVISVRDTGVGIPPQMLSRVFEMFAQMEHTRGRAHGGLGIGLALAKSLVEMHGGRIEARSEGLGKGSEFIVRLPVAEERARPRATEESPVPRVKLPSRKILVVDDTPAALFVLDKLLTALGQHVRTVRDPTEALQAAREDPPDVIISDIGMPVVDGYELARSLRQVPALNNVVLIALTGYGQLIDRQRTKAAGFDQHLVKPVSVDDLQNILENLPPRESD